MNLIGIHGGIGHGKTTFADALSSIARSSLHLESGLLIAQVADLLHAKVPEPIEGKSIEWANRWITALPAILREVVGVDITYEELRFSEDDIVKNPVSFQKLFEHSVHLQVNPKLANQSITQENKKHYRPILQWLGGYLVQKASPTIWYDKLTEQALEASRTGTELCIISGARYLSDIAVIGQAGGHIVEILRPGMPSVDIKDPTERERSQIQSDTKIVNGGNLDDLAQTAKKFYEGLQNGTPQKLYVSPS